MRFVYDALPGRVVFGAGASRERLAEQVVELGLERLLLIFGEPERSLAERLTTNLGERIAGSFTDVRPHVPVDTAESARATALRAKADGLLCLGGGSTTGTAKAIALELSLPIVAVPTTYAGSEMTPVWGMTKAGTKTTGRDPAVLPKVVIYDPELTVSLPASITGPSAINALAHCVEAFYAPGASPVASLLAEDGIRSLSRGVTQAVRDPKDMEGRTLTLYGAYLAGASFAAAGSGIHHKVCHVLGGALDLPHAETHTVVLPHAVAFNEPWMPDVAARVLAALPDGDRADSAAGALFDLNTQIGAPLSLERIGMRRSVIPRIVDKAIAAVPADNPRPVDADGVRALLENAYEGSRPIVREAAAH